MALLHTVNKSPHEKNSLGSCLRLSKPGSTILMIEDGVYGCMKGSIVMQFLVEAMKDRTIYALAADLSARGIDFDDIIDGTKIVDYDGFVSLVEKSSSVQSWL